MLFLPTVQLCGRTTTCGGGFDPTEYIYNQIALQIQRDGLNVQKDNSKTIRVEHLYEELNDNSVQTAGNKYNATLVFYGSCDVRSILPRIKRIKPIQGKPSNEEGKPIPFLAEMTDIDLGTITDIKNQAGYLVMFTIGVDKYLIAEQSNKNLDVALAYFNSAIGVVPENSTAIIPDEAYFYRGNISYLNNRRFPK